MIVPRGESKEITWKSSPTGVASSSTRMGLEPGSEGGELAVMFCQHMVLWNYPLFYTRSKEQCHSERRAGLGNLGGPIAWFYFIACAFSVSHR